jgi:hypothetical protein
MEVIADQAIRVHLPRGLLTGLLQSADKPLAILVIPEDRLATVTAVHDMINCSRILQPQLPCHAPTLLPRLSTVNTGSLGQAPANSESTIMWDPFAFDKLRVEPLDQLIEGCLLGLTVGFRMSYCSDCYTTLGGEQLTTSRTGSAISCRLVAAPRSSIPKMACVENRFPYYSDVCDMERNLWKDYSAGDVNEKIQYWVDLWEELIDNFTKNEYGLELKT